MQPFVAPAAPTGDSIDVAVIGGGLAGLSAALTLARHGCHVTVFEAGRIGNGAAARSAGALGHVPKAGLAELTDLYGRSTALAVYREARQAREYVETLIREHRIECGLRISARFIAAHSPRAFARQRDNLDEPAKRPGEMWSLSPRDEQRREIGSDAFYGGIKLPNSATLQPALFQQGPAPGPPSTPEPLSCKVRGCSRSAARPAASGLSPADGKPIAPSTSILATNADTGTGPARFRALARRLIVNTCLWRLQPRKLTAELMRRVLPIGGPVSDTYKIVHYIAPNETGRRFIISGRAGRADGGLAQKAERLFGYFADRFPDLAGVKVSHCWTGPLRHNRRLGSRTSAWRTASITCSAAVEPASRWRPISATVSPQKILRREESESAFERPLAGLTLSRRPNAPAAPRRARLCPARPPVSLSLAWRTRHEIRHAPGDRSSRHRSCRRWSQRSRTPSAQATRERSSVARSRP